MQITVDQLKQLLAEKEIALYLANQRLLAFADENAQLRVKIDEMAKAQEAVD